MKSIIIGIAGGTGSGKTTLTERLRDHFGADEVSVLNHDSYYKRHDELPYEERCKLNYDHPDSFDTELLVQHLQALRRGESVKVPVYDYTIHNRSDKTITVHPAPVIIVEGILIFASQELCDMMDMKVFVDTDADVRILRRIVRDVKERGRTLDSVVNQYLTTVKPMHEQFVEPSKRKADLIVPEGGRNMVALDMLIKWMATHLSTARQQIEYVFSQHTGFGESVCCVFVFMMGKVQFGSRYPRDVEDAVPYCGAGHIIDSRFSNIPKFRRGQVTTSYRLFHLPSHISNSILQLLTPNFSFSLFPKKFSPFSSFCSNPKNPS